MDPFRFDSFILIINFVVGCYACTTGVLSIIYGCTITKKVDQQEQVPNISRV